MSSLYYLFLIFLFLAVVLFLEGVYLAWNIHMGPQAKRIRERLQAATLHWDGTRTKLLKQRLLSNSPSLERFLLRFSYVRALDRLLQQSGKSVMVAHFLVYTALAAVVGMASAILLEMPLVITLLCVAMGSALPFFSS